jgi:hypothetical protein
VRASGDIRLIVHRSSESLLLCYVDHHDRAYSWAERRKLETHPRTGAAQLVEIRERVEEIAVPRYVEVAPSAAVKPPLFARRSDTELLSYGIPVEWLADVRQANEDSLLELAGHLPAEAAEALLQLATGGQPVIPRPLVAPGVDPFAHPDAQRRFRLMGDLEELERALEYPWDKWTVFLHPAQRQWVERDFAGPARVCGSAATGQKFSLGFLRAEWEELVDAWQLDRWESYRDVKRLGRKTRLPEAQRAALWAIFESVRAGLQDSGLITRAAMFSQLANDLANRKQRPFDFVLVDEAQDVSVSQLRFLAALGAGRPSGLFFAGDLGQRIFQPPFSWLSLGVDIRGRARTLHINYRTSHQIRTQADRLLGPAVSDVDGNTEDRRGTVSAFNGPHPRVSVFNTPDDEASAVGAWIGERVNEGVAPHEIGIFVRSESELDRAREAVIQTGLPHKVLDEHVETNHGYLSIGSMHLAKGLEFRAVAVMACDDEIVPLQARIETVTDDSDLEEVYNTERHLLYVACTRARDQLLVSGVEPASEFLEDLQIP